MRLAVLTGILILVVVQYAGVGNAHKIIRICNRHYPVTPCREHGWYRLHSHRCIRVFRQEKTFEDAYWACRHNHAQLVSIHNQNDYDKVLCLMIRDSPRKYHYWIGAKRRPGNWRKWRWQDRKMMTFHRWARHQPDNWGGGESCLEMNYGYWGRWNDERCGSRRRFVCSKKM
ncbi:C-type isolectin Sp-CL4-like [Genypterus blacodes]|uniref:C-type isolectin Sp-CL4-like n=1 Tax=Genypterus blacodes TaxID=154954 RepID=UPI003F757E0A